MSFIILAGKDRTGKSTVAKFYESKGYKVVHLSVPNKKYFNEHYSGPSYLDEMVDLYMANAGKDVVFDRSPYCELVWPYVYNRKPLLTEEDIEILRELEDNESVERILMHDDNLEANWQRCVRDKEPLTKQQFILANKLYLDMATKYGFKKQTLANYKLEPVEPSKVEQPKEQPKAVKPIKDNLQKLEVANAINDVLSKRILKQKNEIFDTLEADIRGFLNTKLNALFNTEVSNNFSPEDITILRAMARKIREKGSF